MNEVLWIVLIVSGLVCLLYCIQIIRFSLGWLFTTAAVDSSTECPPVSIIVIARDEEKTLPVLLESLQKQDYPRELVEFIFVDDCSEDGTVSIIQQAAGNDARIRYFSLQSFGKSGKKAGIELAVARASAEFLVLTDADCSMGPGWITSMVSGFTEKIAMVVGPVELAPATGFFEKMQTLEFFALMGSTAGSIYWNRPIMANGANIAYKKEVFYAAGGLADSINLASGDDVLLLYKVNRLFPGSIRFLKDSGAIVQTRPCRKLPDFIRQRRRWAAKKFTHLNSSTKYTSLLVFSVSLFLLLYLFFSGILFTFSSEYLPFFGFGLILLGIKCIIDFLLLFLAGSFFRGKHLLIYFLPQEILYMIYVVLIGLLSMRKKQTWKGRMIN